MEIDLAALAHNLAILRARLGPERHIIAALKGDAYGHGIGPVAQRLALCGVHSLATGSLRDSAAIRDAGVELPILMFAGPLPEGMHALLERGLTPTVHDWTSARAISAAAKKPARVYVKVDVGLGRLGVPVADALDFIREVNALDHVVVEGVYTHLSFHDAAGREWARKRYAAFDRLLEALENEGIEVAVTQALASAGLMAGLESRANAVCPGSLLYGMSPVADDVAVAGDYRPVVRSIKSRLIHIGNPPERGRVGVVPLGIADGYQPVNAEAPACALVRGRRVPMHGVSLEYISLDLSELGDAEVGDEVTLLGADGGEEIALSDIAKWQGTAPHVCLMAFEGRLRARYLE
jgi:alanine racemase